MTPQQEYDAFYERELRDLYQRLLNSDTSARNKAGVSMLMATYAVGFAAARAGDVDASLGRAPVQSQIDEVLSLLREILVKSDRPRPTLVES